MKFLCLKFFDEFADGRTLAQPEIFFGESGEQKTDKKFQTLEDHGDTGLR